MQTNVGEYLYNLLDEGMTATEIVEALTEQTRKYEADQKASRNEEIELSRNDVVDALWFYVCALGLYEDPSEDEEAEFCNRTDEILKKVEKEILDGLQAIKKAEAAAEQKKTKPDQKVSLTSDEIKILKFLNSIM